MASNPTPPAYLTFSWLLDLENYEFEGSPHISMRIFVMDACDFYILAQRAARKTSAMKGYQFELCFSNWQNLHV